MRFLDTLISISFCFVLEHKHRIYALARDVGNPSYKDKHFPVARHKDVYTGFSWASGIVPGLRQEESSSEVRLNCIRFYTGFSWASGIVPGLRQEESSSEVTLYTILYRILLGIRHSTWS